jgi:hypothetical protein
MELSRREFFKKAGADAATLSLLVSSTATLRATPLGLPLGSQTYPHRALIKEVGFAGLAKALADIGVQALELCSPLGYQEFAPLADGKEVKKILTDHGLKCESCHFSMRELREAQAKSIAWAQDVGITQMVTATLGGGNTPTMDDVKKAADEYNTIAGVAAKNGMQQGLHNEGFELSEVNGRRTYDILFELLDPKLVKFQFQMSTIKPRRLRRRHPTVRRRDRSRPHSARAALTGSRPFKRQRPPASRAITSNRTWTSRRKACSS